MVSEEKHSILEGGWCKQGHETTRYAASRTFSCLFDQTDLLYCSKINDRYLLRVKVNFEKKKSFCEHASVISSLYD